MYLDWSFEAAVKHRCCNWGHFDRVARMFETMIASSLQRTCRPTRSPLCQPARGTHCARVTRDQPIHQPSKQQTTCVEENKLMKCDGFLFIYLFLTPRQQLHVERVFVAPPQWLNFQRGYFYAQWVCLGPSRKSDIRWAHCGNCINRRCFPKRWEKVASEFKRRVLLRALPQLPSGSRTSVIRWPPAPTTAAVKGAEWLWVWGARREKKTRSHKNKQKQEYNSIHGLCLRSCSCWNGHTEDDDFHPPLRAVWILWCFCQMWVVELHIWVRTVHSLS